MNASGRTLVIAGIALAVLGLLVGYGARLPVRIGRLPGDFVWRGKNSIFYFPLATSILLSVLLSVILWLFGRR